MCRNCKGTTCEMCRLFQRLKSNFLKKNVQTRCSFGQITERPIQFPCPTFCKAHSTHSALIWLLFPNILIRLNSCQFLYLKKADLVAFFGQFPNNWRNVRLFLLSRRQIRGNFVTFQTLVLIGRSLDRLRAISTYFYQFKNT